MVATILGTAVGALIALIMGGLSGSEFTLTIMMAVAAFVGFCIGYVSDFVFLAKSNSYIIEKRLNQSIKQL